MADRLDVNALQWYPQIRSVFPRASFRECWKIAVRMAKREDSPGDFIERQAIASGTGAVKVRRCDVCGKPATNAAKDVYWTENSHFRIVKCTSQPKYGCDEHPAKSDDIDVTDSMEM